MWPTKRTTNWGGVAKAAVILKRSERRDTGPWLSTFSFQARPFYERLGYALIGMLENYPEGHSLFFMTKRLTP